MNKQPYHDLLVWQAAYSFVREVYRATDAYPKHEQYGVVSQLRRAAVSVATNIVEGHGKRSRPDLLRFLDISRGSLTECVFLLELSRDLGYLSTEAYNALDKSAGRVGF